MDLTTTDQDQEETLTSEQLTFARLVSKGYSGVKAYRLAYPAKASLKYATVRVNASKLLTDINIATEVTTSTIRQARMTRLAEERIEDILVNDSSTIKGNKVADVAMFMYEQANGKATQKVELKSQLVAVTYNLTGVDEPVPEYIKQQLAQADVTNK